MLKQQEEIMKAIQYQSVASTRTKAKTVKKGKGEEGRGRTLATNLVVKPTQRRIRSGGVRIEEIHDQLTPQPYRILIDPLFLQVQAVPDV